MILLAVIFSVNQPNANELAHQLMAIWQSGHVDQLTAILSADVVYVDPVNNTQYTGVEQVAGYIKHVHRWASDVIMHIERLESCGNSAFIEWRMTAIQSGPIGDRMSVATMRPIEIRGATFITVEKGLIARAVDYLDALSFVLQLGSKVELPGGTIMQLSPVTD
ncbi:MAG: nuclear transport factor 2 family protein [Acidobacteria bacterium]|nr:nuclear transport factor 2 family protein [Acidobacteriota bacterium]